MLTSITARLQVWLFAEQCLEKALIKPATNLSVLVA
jgi:hypothetical protein